MIISIQNLKKILLKFYNDNLNYKIYGYKNWRDTQEVRYIAVEGVIGAGKTSLTRKLKEKLNAELILEQFEANPFLEKFYSDRKRFAFQTQMFFLINRYKQQEQLNQENLFTEYIVSDYIFEKDRVFAYLNLSGEELKLYESIFPLLARSLKKTGFGCLSSIEC